MKKLEKVYKVLAREYLKWNMVDGKPTRNELENGSQKIAAHILNELYDITSDIYGHNINPVKALQDYIDSEIDIFDIYTPKEVDLCARRITKEEYIKISKELLG